MRRIDYYMLKVRQMFINLVLLAFVLVIMLSLFEGGLRVISSHERDMISTPNGYIYKPNSTIVYETEHFSNTYEINSEGFVDYDHELTSEKYRIALLGDSFIEATQVPFDLALPRLMESVDVEVMSFGLSAIGTSQELIIFNEYTSKYRPDAVVLFFFAGNDLINNHYDLQDDVYRPYYVLEDGELQLVRYEPTLRDRAIKLAKKSYAIRFFNTKFQILLGTKNTQGGAVAKYYVYDDEWPKAYVESWEVTQKVILQLQQDVEKDGAEFLLVVVNGPEHVDSTIREEVEGLIGTPLNWTLPNDKMQVFCETNEIHCIDLKDHFVQASLHIEGNGHWSEEGHRLVSEVVLDALRY